MRTVKVFQIGLGSFGRHGFEKFVDMEKNLPEADVELVGVADTDPEKLRSAEKFAEVHDTEIETFHTAGAMYSRAEQIESAENQVLVYDAGPTESHSNHIDESIHRGFYHLSEKPSSMRREEHIREKRLAEDRDVKWMVDFIERENPVVKKTMKILEDEEVETIKVFRESSMGIQKLFHPVKRAGVKGGDILDKMTHEVYILDFLEAAGIENPEMNLQSVDAEYYMPKDFDSEKMMTITGGYTKSIDETASTAMTHTEFKSSGVELNLNSSWLGASQKAEEIAEEVNQKMDKKIIEREYIQEQDKVYQDEEARFFLLEGSRRILGDMLHGKLYDLEKQEEISTPDLLHDQLYRVLENSVLEAADIVENPIGEKETDTFMNAIFNVRDKAVQTEDFWQELEKAHRKLDAEILEDGKTLEDTETKSIAG